MLAPRARAAIFIVGPRGRVLQPAFHRTPLMNTADFDAYLGSCRDLVLTEIRSLVPPTRRPGDVLPELVLDYPLRAAKGLRPALCIATCRAYGGSLEGVLRSAAALELYH